MFWRIIWPAIIIVFFAGAMLISHGCGGGGGGSDTKADNQNNNQNPPADQNTNPPADNKTDPPPDNTDTNPSPDIGNNQPSYKFIATGDMSIARSGHTSTLLNNGDVLVIGGWNIGAFQSGAELYHPDTGVFETIDDFPVRISTHTATHLKDGRIFVYGMGAAIYNPETKKFISVSREGSIQRISHTATMLHDGKILIAGGVDNSWLSVVLGSAVLYNPNTGIYSSTGSMVKSRTNHAATLLADGRVLITGGTHGGGYGVEIAEIFDPATGKFTAIGTMRRYRYTHTATILKNGKVVIIGGTAYADIEIFDPVTNKFELGGYLKVVRDGNHTATILPNGKILILGSLSSGVVTASAEVYDSEVGFSSVNNMLFPRYYHTTTLLQNGKVLVVGGAAKVNSNYLKSAELME